MNTSKLYLLLATLLIGTYCFSQNSMVGDGFGGRLWYNPTNYTVGSYSAYSICQDICGTGETQLYGWGDNQMNQIGLGWSVSGVNIPTPIPNTEGVTYYSTGYIMGAIKNDSTGWAWGNSTNDYPMQVISNVKFLDASSTTISFVKHDGTVWSIGDNSKGQFGDGTIGGYSDSIPIQMLNINNAVRVANSWASTIILLSDSTLMSVGNDWGLGYLGLGDSITEILTPMPISGLPKIIDIKSNAMGTLALSVNGDVYFWGEYSDGFTFNTTPIKMPNLSNIVAISGCDDGYHFLALDENKNCYAWGDNWGQFGISSLISNTTTPQIVETDIIDIMAGETFSYFVKSDGSLWASGGSNIGGSIWLNLPDLYIELFTQLDPSQVSGSCELVGITPYFISNCDSTNLGTISIDNFGGQAPYTYSIGGAFQNSNVFNNVSIGNYTITVKDVNGCQYSTTANVNGVNCPSPPTPIEPIPPQKEPYIHFPNVFSPNHDGENDLFYFPNEGVTEMYCKIYNRWGNLIYEFSQINEGWNGRTNSGVECPVGTYFYVVYYKMDNSDWETEKGYLTLLR